MRVLDVIKNTPCNSIEIYRFSKCIAAGNRYDLNICSHGLDTIRDFYLDGRGRSNKTLCIRI